MTTGSVIVGKLEVGEIVRTPAPGILKTIVSRPGEALASRIACWREPAPLSLVLVTVKVLAAAATGSNQIISPPDKKSSVATYNKDLIEGKPLLKKRGAKFL
jgi:hypothetical protein